MTRVLVGPKERSLFVHKTLFVLPAEQWGLNLVNSIARARRSTFSMEIESKAVPAVDAASMAEHDAKNDTEQFRGLRRIPDKLPAVALLILVVEVSQWSTFVSKIFVEANDKQLGERATYFGLSGPFQNYIKSVHRLPAFGMEHGLTEQSNPYAPGSDLPGALGKGQAVATALGNFFKFWAYASTVIGAIIAGALNPRLIACPNI